VSSNIVKQLGGLKEVRIELQPRFKVLTLEEILHFIKTKLTIKISNDEVVCEW